METPLEAICGRAKIQMFWMDGWHLRDAVMKPTSVDDYSCFSISRMSYG